MARTMTHEVSPRDEPFGRDEVLHVYRRRASRYDLTSHLYWVLGYRLDRYRREGVEALKLARGETVIEIGCGTEHNIPALVEAVGPEGRVVGVDLTDAMLAQARRPIERAAWRNVELVQSDATAFAFPRHTDGVLSTYALTIVPGFDEVIRRAAAALVRGKRMVVVGLQGAGGVADVGATRDRAIAPTVWRDARPQGSPPVEGHAPVLPHRRGARALSRHDVHRDREIVMTPGPPKCSSRFWRGRPHRTRAWPCATVGSASSAEGRKRRTP